MQRSTISNIARRRFPGSPTNTFRARPTSSTSQLSALYPYRNPATSSLGQTCHQQSQIRAFHSSGDFADYMKQVMSPMTGHVGEQTPSEESNTLREIDRLFTIISSKQQSFITRLPKIDSQPCDSRERMSEDFNHSSPSHARPSIRTMARRHLRRGKQHLFSYARDSTAESRGWDENDGG
jgi:hypothetical protein